MLQMIELKQEGKEIFDFDKFIKNVNFQKLSFCKEII